MHRAAVALIAFASALSVSRVAHSSALLCGEYLAGEYRPEELRHESRLLAEALDACVCEEDCASVCVSCDPEEGNYACGVNDPLFVSQGGDTTACNACISGSCGSLFLACYFDH